MRKPHVRVRLRLPTGAEIEVEGSQDFVEQERRSFLSQFEAPAPVPEASPAAGHLSSRLAQADLQAMGTGGRPWEAAEALPGAAYLPSWDSLTETHRGVLQLRTKLKTEESEKDASLVLMAAAQKLLNNPKPTASQLAKWLRVSGYPVGRIDRVLQGAVETGEILATGSRRARRYELTAHGRMKAFILARQLQKLITGT